MMGINRSYAFEAFKPWSDAIDTWNTLEEYDKVSTLRMRIRRPLPRRH